MAGVETGVDDSTTGAGERAVSMTATVAGIHEEKEGRRRKEGRKESVCVKKMRKRPRPSMD